MASAFHPDSPAGRLLALARPVAAVTSFEFTDPLAGEGGFGASTAQFALVYGVLAERLGWDLSPRAVRRVYRELMSGEKLPPSGADLVAQLTGGVVAFDAARETVHVRSVSSTDWGRSCWWFSAAGQAGRKVPTHEHLARIADAGRAGG